MSEGLERWQKVQNDAVVKNEVLDAAKEALVSITARYTIPRELSVRTAHSLVAAFRNYRDVGEESKRQLRDIAIHVVDEEFINAGFGTDDILQAFEKSFDDHFPHQSPK